MLRFDIALQAIRNKLKPAAKKTVTARPSAGTAVLIPFPAPPERVEVGLPTAQKRRAAR